MSLCVGHSFDTPVLDINPETDHCPYCTITHLLNRLKESDDDGLYAEMCRYRWALEKIRDGLPGTQLFATDVLNGTMPEEHLL